MIYFSSDHHFFHKNIIKYENRPFQNLDEMHEYYIQEWNDTVKSNDTIYYLGDLTCNQNNLLEIKHLISKLNGHIHFIRGNHDHKKIHQCNLASVQDYKCIKINGQNIVLFHYPIASWRKMGNGSWHLFGHCHGNYQNLGKSLDVGIDNVGRIISFDEVKEIMDKKEIVKVDHH